jgi:hypothetical protein
MNLFEDHDIVVLYERMHPEYTQWELFSRIILNDTFATKIGNVATEFGRVSEQARLDSLMSTRFENEEEREQSFAALVRENGGMWGLWVNTNIYDFAVALSKFNEKRDTNTKINWFFTRVSGSWKDVHTTSDWNRLFYNNKNDDYNMANRVITIQDSLKQKSKTKILLITNTTHAYRGKPYGDIHEADYLFKHYKERIAFVWLNSTSLSKNGKQVLYKHGLLDAVSETIQDSSWAISFSNSMIGEDLFENPSANMKRDLKMKNLFDGMIYHGYPYQQYGKYGYPHVLTNFMDTFLKRSAVIGEDYLAEAKKLSPMFTSGKSYITPLYYYSEENLIFYTVNYFILLWLLVNLILILKIPSKKSVLPV